MGARRSGGGVEDTPTCTYTLDKPGETRPEPEETGEACPECGKPLLQRVGRFGPFIGCSGYPDCKYIKKQEKGTGITCPQCNEGELVVKRTRRGKTFYGCNRYPECDFAVWQRPAPDPCPACGKLMTYQAKGDMKCTECGEVVKAEPAAAGS